MQVIEWAFGRRTTPAERLRKHQRALDKTLRELDREKRKLEQQESSLKKSIKTSAEKGQLNAAKVQAKDLVRTRKYIERFGTTSVQLKAIGLRIQVGFSSLFDLSALTRDAITRPSAPMNK